MCDKTAIDKYNTMVGEGKKYPRGMDAGTMGLFILNNSISDGCASFLRELNSDIATTKTAGKRGRRTKRNLRKSRKIR